MMTTLLLLTLLAGPQAAGHAHDQAVKQRGAHVMGFDQDATVHHFRLHTDGGAIDIAVKDPNDTANRAAIRSHLPHITQMFGDGNFEAPMLIHDTDVPGTKTLAALKDRVRFVYVETPGGGRVDIFTTDREALAAVHEFMKFQIRDHGTGDSIAITKR
jgi:hypothetical protein